MSSKPEKPRLSERQIATLKHLAVTCAGGGLVTLTRDQRQALLPLWDRGIIEIWYRCIRGEGKSGVPFFRPTTAGWNLIRAIVGSPRRGEANAA
jgi:hypothetical protein